MNDDALIKQIDEFSKTHPRSSRAYRAIVRRRLFVFMALICAISIYDLWFDNYEPLDPIWYFGPAGLALFSGDWVNTFSEPAVQIGPLLVALFGLGALVNQATGLSIHLVVSPVVQILVVLGTLRLVSTLRSADAKAFPGGLRLFTGLVVLLGGIAWETSASGHTAESLGAILWVAAAYFSRRGEAHKAAAMIAITAIMKPWGLLGLPILLLNPRLSRAVWGGAIAVAASTAAYLPFAVWGQMRMFDVRWQVTPHSPLRILMPSNASFDWNMRLIQGTATMLVAAALVLMIRRSTRSVWIAPLQVSLARLAFDPLEYHYYWMTPALIIMIGLLSEIPAEPSWRRIMVPPVFFILVWPFFYMRGMPLAILTIIMLVSMMVGSIYLARRTPGIQRALA